MARIEQEQRVTVRSADTTRLGMARTGDGPMLVELAVHHRAVSASTPLCSRPR
jgi:hypothetical protein